MVRFSINQGRKFIRTGLRLHGRSPVLLLTFLNIREPQGPSLPSYPSYPIIKFSFEQSCFDRSEGKFQQLPV